MRQNKQLAASCGEYGLETRQMQVFAGIDLRSMLRPGVVIPDLEIDDPWEMDLRSAEFHRQQALHAVERLRAIKGLGQWLDWDWQLRVLRYHRARASQHRQIAFEMEQAFSGLEG